MNDPIIHAKASKIVEAIINELMKRKGSELGAVITSALASLGGEENELCIDISSLSDENKNRLTEELVKLINTGKVTIPHPSEREVLRTELTNFCSFLVKDLNETLNNPNSNKIGDSIDRYLSEKSKTEKK